MGESSSQGSGSLPDRCGRNARAEVLNGSRRLGASYCGLPSSDSRYYRETTQRPTAYFDVCFIPWHGRGHRFDPGQVHQSIQAFSATSLPRLCRILVANSKTLPETDPGFFFSEAAIGSVVVAVIVTTTSGLRFPFAGFDAWAVAPATAV